MERAKNLLSLTEVIRDKVCLVRKVNYPELVFRPDMQDFRENEEQRWKLAEDQDCYICMKSKYTMIFYSDQKKDSQRNKEFTEITDPEFLSKCRANFESFKPEDECPVILGSVTQGLNLKKFNKFSQGKHLAIKMMRADYYTMLSVS